MVNNNSPYLCGGIFFALLLEIRKQRSKARDKFLGGSDGLSDTDILKGLIYVVANQENAPYAESFKKNTSEYKSCRYSGGAYIPFKKTHVINSFDNDVKNKYPNALNRMSEFVNKYLDESKIEWLVKALLETIDLDTRISGTHNFYIQSSGQAITKAELATLTNIELQPFLLGVLHYIILHRPDNKLGRPTYEAWYTQSTEYSEWEFTSGIGSGINRPLNITFTPMQEESTPEDEEIPEFSEWSDEATDDTTSKTINQFINNPTIVNQRGKTNIHINHVDTLKL
ncbi:NACHT domain protein [Desulfitobacterium hafniense]|uniref:NACHT domain protein n=1 Tax=Desulfitobacterium hafniense TaxID=49338 RepID=A0A098B3M2_DESHA|nr:hypothetical protein [Desulfitobacterium hafniense]CDX03463.1 NACHT domain protein [Desulfitobacterium hafniense]